MLGTWQLFFFFLFEKITIVKVENYNFSNITFNRGKIPGEFLELFSWLREKGLDALKGKKKKNKKKRYQNVTVLWHLMATLLMKLDKNTKSNKTKI